MKYCEDCKWLDERNLCWHERAQVVPSANMVHREPQKPMEHFTATSMRTSGGICGADATLFEAKP